MAKKVEAQLERHPAEYDHWVRTHAIEIDVDRYVVPFDPDDEADRARFLRMEEDGDLKIYGLPRKELARFQPAYGADAGKILEQERNALVTLAQLKQDVEAAEKQAVRLIQERDSTTEGPEAFDRLAEQARKAREEAEAAEGRYKAQQRKVQGLVADRKNTVEAFNAKSFKTLEVEADRVVKKFNQSLDYALIPEFNQILNRMKECQIEGFIPYIQHTNFGLTPTEAIGLQTFKLKPQIAKVSSGYKFIVEKAHGNGVGRAV